jgi:hypothetical protein
MDLTRLINDTQQPLFAAPYWSYANYGLLRGTFTQRCRVSEKRMAKIVITVIRVRAISFPDIQTPLRMWLSGQAEPLTEGEEKPALSFRG